MLQVAAGRRVTAALAAAVLSLCHGHALAQDDPDPYGELDAPLDPSAPLAPMPDLGVPWLEMEEETGEDIADAGSEEHTSELQSLMRISYAVFCLKKTTNTIVNEQMV